MRTRLLLWLVRLIAALPRRFLYWLAILVGSLAYLFPNRECKTASLNLRLCLPELTPGVRRRLLWATLVENAKTLLETPAIWYGDARYWAALVRDPSDGELARRLLAAGKGLIIAAPHLGSWEAGVHKLAQIAPITALYRPLKEGSLAEAMLAGRSRSGAHLVPTTAAGVKALYAALERGEMITILPDQQPPSRTKGAGVFAPFFGVPALTMVLVNRLARRTGAPVVFAYAERLPGTGGFELHWLEAPEGIADVDPLVGAQALNLGVEQVVRRCPQQYQWTYKRFRARPEGQPRLYD